ncbi:MAG: PAS domain S-box protein, partial [Gammaproteobacteria bacterium]
EMDPGDTARGMTESLGYYPDEEVTRQRKAFFRTLKTGEGFVLEQRARTRGGREIRVELRCGGKVQRPDGEYLVGTIQDVTGRRAQEEQLQRLGLVVEYSPQTVVITSIEPRVLYVNRAFEQATGYAPEEVIGKHPEFMVAKGPDKQEEMARGLALLSGRSWEGEQHTRRKDGSEFLESVRVWPLRAADGTLSELVAISEDITEKRRVERELDSHRHHLRELVQSRTRELEAATRIAEHALQARSRFLANMSHEIRTPMNAILGLAHLLETELTDTRARDRVHRIGSSARHLLGIINDILDFSKIEADRLTLESVPMSISSIVDASYSMVAERAREKGLALRVGLEPGLGELPLRGDPTRLGQVLLNYLSNALKFTDAGSIEIELSCNC